MSGDYYQQWRDKAQVDYFPSLVLMWLSTNSWYRSHYSEIESKKDRNFINALHDDNTGRNKLYKQLDVLLGDKSKRGVAFLSHLESLFYALNSAGLKWEDKAGAQEVSFRYCMRHNTRPVEYFSIIEDVPRPQKTSEAENARIRIDDRTVFVSARKEVFSGLLEIIYKVRCLLVHGQLEPTKENHDVVRQCYFVLQMMMDF
jgi:hypothetical protein